MAGLLRACQIEDINIMSRAERSTNRRQQILQTLAQELETNPGSRITTAALARAVGVSEAALYRHFPSKAKMFEALIDFAEETIFGSVSRILEQEKDVAIRCEKIISILLVFSERNPGISRVLIGDALVGENERLRKRVSQFFDRLESQLKQILRESNLGNGQRPAQNIEASANAMLALVEGRISQFIRSSFQNKPTVHMDEQWAICKPGLFKI